MRSTRQVLLILMILFPTLVMAQDLKDILNQGVLRHIGAPYGNFVIVPDKKKNTRHSGFSVDLVRLYAESIGVKYEFIESDNVHTMIEGLVGIKFRLDLQNSSQVSFGDELAPVGDVIATGLTVLDWRKKLINYSESTFPSKIWLIGHKNLQKIIPEHFDQFDKKQVLEFANKFQVIGQANTSIDPSLYGVNNFEEFKGSINDYINLVTNLKENKLAMLDFPDAIVTLRKAPEKLIVIGELSGPQTMAAAFRKGSPKLLKSFNAFLEAIKINGTYERLVNRYYPELVFYKMNN
ncbi:MAG: transporter substrate-binding domain-containing protein [bacterium]